MPITEIEYCFFRFLRTGLWGNECNCSYLHEGNIDWVKIWDIAYKQTVVGIILDGVVLTPYRPDDNLMLKWLWGVKKIEDDNARLNVAIVDVISKFHDAGLHPVLMKGHAVRQYYRNPNHRQAGDIDLYFNQGYDCAKELMERWTAYGGHEETIHHKSFTVKGLDIEIHKVYSFFYNKKNSMSWEKVQNELLQNHEETLYLNNKKGKEINVRTFNPQMNAIYLFLHMQHHLLQTGIGLRQVCDWACLWKTKEKDIDKELFMKIVDLLPVKRCMTALTWVVENYLGLPKGIIPLDTTGKQTKKDGELLLRDILDSGNFGKKSAVMDGFIRNNHWNNIKNYTLAFRRMMKLRRLCPSEVDAYIKYWISEKLSLIFSHR